MISRIYKFLFRNNYSRNGEKLQPGRVNLEYFKDSVNLGDCLSPVVCEYMLAKRSLSFASPTCDGKIAHLNAIGSILGGRGDYDATVWGSGVRCFSSIRGLCRKKLYQELDIRAVRGPITRAALEQCGIPCPSVYGDPAILMPLIYSPNVSRRHGTVMITHYLTPSEQYRQFENITLVDIKTEDYKKFIDIISSAEIVVSSSLHGIILAEAYGVPAVFLQEGIESETLKFYDWYYSTNRKTVQVASSLQEALAVDPMPLPELKEMQELLMQAFPFDLWEGK